jgi:GNAT superfamily N-acetyltransferase
MLASPRDRYERPILGALCKRDCASVEARIENLTVPIEYRTLDYANTEEMRRYLTLFYAIPAGHDEYYVARSAELIEASIVMARQLEDETNTFSGIAVDQADVVGLHILRRFEEGGVVGVHIAGLWVAEAHRGMGVARRLKERGEAWARSIGAEFLNTNVRIANARMLAINERAGFKPYKINLRKRL